MRKTFKIVKDYYDTGQNIFEKSSVTFDPGLTVLVGCNGSGKTTLLKQMKSKCKVKNIPVVMFDNLRDGGSNAISAAGYYGNFDALARGIMSSEGENITDNIANFGGQIGRMIRSNPDAEAVFILMDAIDSGLSVDNVIEVKEEFFKMILNDCKNMNVFIIVSANEYEMARGEKCFDVGACKYVEIKDYEDYRKLIVETRKKKNKHYKHEEFKYD